LNRFITGGANPLPLWERVPEPSEGGREVLLLITTAKIDPSPGSNFAALILATSPARGEGEARLRGNVYFTSTPIFACAATSFHMATSCLMKLAKASGELPTGWIA